MRTFTRSRRAIAVLVLAAACTSTPSPPPSPRADGGTATSTPPSSGSASGRADAAAVLRPPPGGSFLVRGAYPPAVSRCVDAEPRSLTARYPGALSVTRSEDGTLAITVTLPFDRYLQGIAEVPPSWPAAALEAQAIAARSYALATTGWDGQEGEPLREPICATTACQVYRGIPVPFEPSVRRWYGAVRRTSGQVLLFDGRPADTVYFSTSNGHTYGNEDVFGSAPLPYLRPVPERDDGASPTSRWTARIAFLDLATFLHAGGVWPAHQEIADVRLDGESIEVSGAVSRSMELSTFRDAVNAWAPCLAPDRFPPPSRLGSALPVTIPSRWLHVRTTTDAVVVSGRGWGHVVGIVQWGA